MLVVALVEETLLTLVVQLPKVVEVLVVTHNLEVILELE